jgi:hypothetical protein
VALISKRDILFVFLLPGFFGFASVWFGGFVIRRTTFTRLLLAPLPSKEYVPAFAGWVLLFSYLVVTLLVLFRVI